MKDRSQQSDLFDTCETTERLYDLPSALCFMLTLGVIAVFELR